MRSAGEDAWLGKPAPEDPTLDGPSNHSTSLLQIENGHPGCKDMHLASKKATTQALTAGMLLTLILCVWHYQMLLSHMHSGCSGCMTSLCDTAKHPRTAAMEAAMAAEHLDHAHLHA